MGDGEHRRGVGRAGAEEWEDYTTHGCVKPSQSIIGRPKLLTPDTIENIQELLREDPTFLLDEIKEWLVFQLRPCT